MIPVPECLQPANVVAYRHYSVRVQAQSVDEIAQTEGVTNACLTRVTHLAMLAPDIVQNVVRGDHPPALNADRLIHRSPLPMDWTGQRALPGFHRQATKRA
ncbi:MAG: hypothetical protein MUC86_01675 [Burkholderiaceae bacterium]|nr:hypothetical protein [Burkholderiaceae bacterium]